MKKNKNTYTHYISKANKKKQPMACDKLPHTVEEIQEYVRKQAEIEDTARQEALTELINKFEHAKILKQQLRTQYHECTHMSDDRKFVINNFLYAEFRKDHAVVEKLRSCVSGIHAQKKTRYVGVTKKMWKLLLLSNNKRPVHQVHLHQEVLMIVAGTLTKSVNSARWKLS